MQINQLKQNAGFALIEVLLSFVILAFGMLGIAGMMLVGHKANSSSYIKQQAIQSAYDIVERMRIANKSAATLSLTSYNVNNLTTSGAPTIPGKPSTDCSTVACTPAQLAAYDTWSWLSQDLAQIPNGSGKIVATVAAGSPTTVVVTVQWDDSAAQSTLGASSATNASSPNLAQFTIQTQL